MHWVFNSWDLWSHPFLYLLPCYAKGIQILGKGSEWVREQASALWGKTPPSLPAHNVPRSGWVGPVLCPLSLLPTKGKWVLRNYNKQTCEEHKHFIKEMINEWLVLYEPGLMKQKFEINIINFLQETKEKQEYTIIKKRRLEMLGMTNIIVEIKYWKR